MVSFEEAVATLEAMFSDSGWSREQLVQALQMNGNHVENTVEFVLASGGPPAAELPPPATHSAPSSAAAAPGPGLAPAPAPRASGAYRGRRTELPPSFLRAPGWQQREAQAGDEALALMLQDEMFRRQVQAELGQDWLSQLRNPQLGGQAARRQQQERRASQHEGQPDAFAQLSKSLADMGESMRKKMNDIALRFRQRQEGHDHGSSQPLTGDDGSGAHPDDETEIITFDTGAGSRGAHSVNDELDDGASLVNRRSKKDN